MAEFQEKLIQQVARLGDKLDKVTLAQEDISHRLGELEGPTFGQKSPLFSGEDGQQPPSSGKSHTTSEDIQAEFQSLKDSVQKVKLPGDLRLNDSRVGIKSFDKAWAGTVTKSARYVETTLKLISQISSKDTPITTDDIESIFCVQLAHIKYLQEEYQTVLVKGSFGNKAADVFKKFKKNTSSFDQESIQVVKDSVALAQSQHMFQQFMQPQQSSYRGYGGYQNPRGRGGYNAGFNNSQNPWFQDNYQRFTNRSFGYGRGFQPNNRNFDRSQSHHRYDNSYFNDNDNRSGGT